MVRPKPLFMQMMTHRGFSFTPELQNNAHFILPHNYRMFDSSVFGSVMNLKTCPPWMKYYTHLKFTLQLKPWAW